MAERVVVIGAGFAGMAAATVLAEAGCEVIVLEKNSTTGGRSRAFRTEGFLFDMGPSWYWMPDVFERYFARFNRKPSDYYELVRLDPSYQVIFPENESWRIPAAVSEIRDLFERTESGAGARLDEFLREAAYKYKVGMRDLVYKPSLSPMEFLDKRIFASMRRLHLFTPFNRYIRKFFRHQKLLQLLEFPILFLGAKPEKTPALYSLMNYADMALGTWYPMGGMNEIAKGVQKMAEEKGVVFHTNSPVSRVRVNKSKVTGVECDGQFYPADLVVAGADYHHVEQELIPQPFRKYGEGYWQSREMAPSSLLFYIGTNCPVPKLLHHNLFFDEDFSAHAASIYDRPSWPERPQFYVCCPSKTDRSVAPEGCENLFILIPVAPGLKDADEIREKYFGIVMDRLEHFTGTQIRQHLLVKKSYAHNDFVQDYNSFKGNAYGLANTLRQTAFMKPRMRTHKISNLVFTGQLTVPGPGVPPSLISGQIAAEEILRTAQKNNPLRHLTSDQQLK